MFERWRQDFHDLYNRDDSTCNFNDEHYRQANAHKQELEAVIEDHIYSPNVQLNETITIAEVSRLVMRAKSGSACGPDEVPYDVLKKPQIIVVLRDLFQLIFDASLIPTIWRKAVICPILKDINTDKRIPLNYRGVSLLSCIGKLYSAFLNKRLTKFLNDNDLLADEQNGFRAERSCEDHVFVLNSIVKNNKNVFSAFVDLKKCFDFIDRDMLLYKLLLHKIDGKMYKSIRNLYDSSSSCIRINNKLTTWFDCTTGVKQGDNLSPTLVSIFTNDIIHEINELDIGIDLGGTKVSILMYADDIVLVSDTEAKLQTMLDLLDDWCNRWRVIINMNKSKCVHFRRGRAQRTEFNFKVGELSLEVCSAVLQTAKPCRGPFKTSKKG